MPKKKASHGRAKAAKKFAPKARKSSRAKTTKKSAPKGRNKARRSAKTAKKTPRKAAKAGTPKQAKTELREQWAADTGTSLMEEYISSSSGSEHFGI